MCCLQAYRWHSRTLHRTGNDILLLPRLSRRRRRGCESSTRRRLGIPWVTNGSGLRTFFLPMEAIDIHSSGLKMDSLHFKATFMLANDTFWKLANESSVKKTMENLQKNGIESIFVSSWKEAREKLLKILPKKAEVMTMTSMTLNELWIDTLVNGSMEFNSVRNQLMKESLEKSEKQRLGAAHEWVLWSVHAVTEGGQVVIASNTGSQLGSYAYGATNVIWFVGTQKIVKDFDEAMKRIEEYAYPLENERALKAYGTPSGISKLLIVNREVVPGRIRIIFIDERLGF